MVSEGQEEKQERSATNLSILRASMRWFPGLRREEIESVRA